MQIKYGLPYRGSKKAIAPDIVDALPAAINLYDLFAGGCAISHCALLSGRYKNVFANDLNDAPQLFLDAVDGKYKNERRWISREQFHAEKAIDPYIRWVWSFGNNGCDYLFGKENEEIKKVAHEYLFKNGYDGTTKTRIKLIKQFKTDKNIVGRFELERLQQLQQLQQLEQLERFQQLQQLQQLERLQITQKDYRKIKIRKDSVVYCDIPYAQKANRPKRKYYGLDFNHEEFYEWARSAAFPVYFSSVFAPKDFKVVWSGVKQCTIKNINSHGQKEVIEKLFWNGVKCK